MGLGLRGRSPRWLSAAMEGSAGAAPVRVLSSAVVDRLAGVLPAEAVGEPWFADSAGLHRLDLTWVDGPTSWQVADRLGVRCGEDPRVRSASLRVRGLEGPVQVRFYRSMSAPVLLASWSLRYPDSEAGSRALFEEHLPRPVQRFDPVLDVEALPPGLVGAWEQSLGWQDGSGAGEDLRVWFVRARSRVERLAAAAV